MKGKQMSSQWTARTMADSLNWEWNENRGEYQGLCPLHTASGTHEYNAGIRDGKNPGVVVFHCFAKCNPRKFFDEMRGRGFERPQSLADRTKQRQEVCRYAYTDEHNTILYYNIRYDPKDFRVARPGPHGDLIWSLKEYDTRVIYAFPKVVPASRVYFCEGEKDADALLERSLAATCIIGGASAWSKFAAQYVQQLTGKEILLLPHNDDAGVALMREVAESLRGHATRVASIELPGRPPGGGDVVDWLGAGGTIDQLHRLTETALATANTTSAHSSPVFQMPATELMRQDFPPLRWFATGLLHEGMVLFGGKSKRGKSWIALNLAVSIATGGLAFGQYEVPESTDVLYCALEDGPRRTQRRLRMIAHGADLSRLTYTFRMPPLEDGGLQHITEHIKAGCGVVIVDVLAHVEKAGKDGMRNYHEVYNTFAPLQELRSAYPFALIMITHLRKAESEEVFDNLHGSVAYQGAQDALWVMERKQGEGNALLHLRDKDAEDKTIELQFDGAGIWSFVGEGEEHQATTLEHRIIALLREEGKPQTIKEVLQALDLPGSQYGAMRVRLQRMVARDILIRTDHGRYAVPYREIADDFPF